VVKNRSTDALLLACSLTLPAVSIAEAGGTTGSFQLLGMTGLTPTDASSDGRVVAGYNTSQFWYWTPEQGLVTIGGLSPSAGGAGSAGVSDDGTRIGYTIISPQTGKTEGAFYEVASGQTTSIGNFGFSCDVSATSCWGVSGDGYTIVGTARTAAGVQGFILDLPRPAQCPADFNDDGAVNGDDLGVLLGAWGACPSSACEPDLNDDGAVNGDDLGVLLGAWGACGAG
jgi:hypothetical protein